jgi:hypothetical protein
MGAIGLGNNPTPPSMACAFTGAGESGYIDAFFADAMKDIQTSATQKEFGDFLSDKVHKFYERHLFPLAFAKDPPDMQILVGAYAQWQTCMFVSHGSTLRRVFPHAAIGIGSHFASSLIDEIGGIKDVRHTELLAAFVVGVTKERIEGCGKYTAIVSLHNSVVQDIPGEPSRLVPPPNILTHVSGKKIRKWEESFATRWAPRQVGRINELVEEELANELTPSPGDQTQS